MQELFPGSTQVAVYRPRNKNPHFLIVGARVEDLDPAKVSEYMYGVIWDDRRSPAWYPADVRCDEFLKEKV